MPLLRISLISVVLAVTCFLPTAGAQKPHAVPQRNRPTEQIILTRTLAERVETARQVLKNPQAQLLASDSFVLTPRRPYVDGRGALDSYQAQTYLLSTNTGTISPWNDGDVSVHLFYASGKRFLVDCRVQDETLKPTTFFVKFADQSTVQLKAVNGLLSFVTPLGSSFAVITINGDDGMFSLMGCEITKLA